MVVLANIETVFVMGGSKDSCHIGKHREVMVEAVVFCACMYVCIKWGR